MNDPLTERNIQAFADGSGHARAERIGRHLGECPNDTQRVAFYRILNRRLQDVFGQVAGHRMRKPRAARLPIGAALRNMFLGVCAVLAATGWCVAAHVSADMLCASAVMALMETSAARSAHALPLVSHDPHFIALTPVGLALVATKTRHAGKFADIDEFDYRNADGEAVILLSARAPLVDADARWSAQRVGDIRLLSWTSDGKRYVLAGRAGTHGLMRAADALTMTAQKAE